MVFQVCSQRFNVFAVVVLESQVFDDGGKVMVLLLHLLVMASALLGLPGADKGLHGLEYLVHPPHVSVHKMFIVNLQEPMVFLVLLQQPVSPVHILFLLQRTAPLPLLLGERTLHLHLVLLIECEESFFVEVRRGVLFGKRTQGERVVEVEDFLFFIVVKTKERRRVHHYSLFRTK